MIPSLNAIRSSHHLMLSVCSAAPKPLDDLCAIADARQRRAGTSEDHLVSRELAELALGNLQAFKYLARIEGGYRLTALGEQKLIELDTWHAGVAS